MHPYPTSSKWLFLMLLFLCTGAKAQISSLEYYFDTDPGFGNGTSISSGFTPGNTVTLGATIPVTGLAGGFHTLHLRARAGNRWGQSFARVFYVTTIGGTAVSNAEYFFDTDPGPGNGTSLAITAGATVSQAVSIPVAGLQPGFHQLYIRAKNTNGSWGQYQTRAFLVTNVSAGNGQLTTLEYFFDTDPGDGQGTALSLSASDTVNQVISIPAGAATPGFHQLYLRAKNDRGTWSHYQTRSFFITNMAGGSARIAGAEYFIDTDPGNGNGTAMAINPPMDTVARTFSLDVPAGLAEGNHRLVIRVKNERGQWSHYQTASFYNPRPKPGSGNALSFDGSDDYAAITFNTAPVANNFTYELWVKPAGTISIVSQGNSGVSGTGGQQYVLAPNHGGNSNAGMGLSVGTNGVQVFEHGSSYMPALLSWSHPLSGWTHLAVVYDNKQPSLYVNGVLVQTGVASVRDSVLPFVDQYTEFGRGSYGYYNGQLDEVRLWKVALTQAQVRDWMCKKLTAAHPQFADLVGSFNFDEQAVPEVYATQKSGSGMLLNGAARVLSGAAIGDVSAHSYAGANAGTSLANPSRGDALSATLTSGMADGIQIYCVTDTPNNANGTACLGANNGYFGVFAANGNAPAYDASYNYTGMNLNGLDESLVALYRRSDNSDSSFVNANAVLDTAANTLAAGGTSRAEYIISNAVVLPTIAIAPAPNDTVCAGTLVTFTAAITNGGAAPAFQWKKNGSNVGTNSNAYADNALLDGDVITCELTSNSPCVSNAVVLSNAVAMTITNTLAASVTATVSPGDTVCAGTQVLFTASPVNGGTNPVYQWRVNGTALGGNAATFTSNSLADGDVVSVEMQTSAGCALPALASSSGIVLHVHPVLTPTLSIAANTPATVCEGTPVTFTATSTNGGTAPVYQWRKNGTPVGGNMAVYSDNGLVNGDLITCSMSSTATCANPVNVTSNGIAMTVHPTAAPVVNIYNNTGNTVCAGAGVQFTATVINGGTTPVYQWTKNNVPVGTNSATYTDNALADHDVIRCMVTSSEVCANPGSGTSNAITMTVNPYVMPSVSIGAAPTGAICAGSNVTFTAMAVNGGNAPAYQWKKNGNNVGVNTAAYTDITLADGDRVSCVLTSNAGCTLNPVATSDTIVMTVHPLPAVNAGSDQVILQGSSVVLTASGADNYAWNTGDTTAAIVAAPASTTTYTVSTTNSYGCTASDDVLVTVNFSSLALSPSGYNYGDVVVNMPQTYNLTLTNNGTLTETISAVSVNAPFSAAFTPQVLAPGSSLNIPVTFTPAGTLVYQQPLSIATTAGSYQVVLQGRGVSAAPAWALTPASYNFGNIIAGDSTSHLFMLANTGNVPVSISNLVSTDAVFVPALPINTIAVGAQALLQVKFKPAAVAGYAGTVSVSASNAGLSPVSVGVSGAGYIPGNAPVLSFAAAAPYNGASGVDFPVGPAGTFTYRVIYRSPDGRAPMSGYPRVGIDRNADGDFLDADEGVFTMSQAGNGTDWLNGEPFTYTLNLGNGNTYGYQFSAKDSLGNTATSVGAAYKSGPVVTSQSLDLAIYANDITFSNNNPAAGQQFTVSAVLHNNSPYSASNVPVRFYKDSLFLASDVVPFIAANSTATLTRNFSFSPDGFYPIKVWIDSAATLGENNVLNNYAIRPVIVGNFSLPGTINITSSASTQSCPGPGVLISGYATYSGLNLQGNPPVLGATVSVQIAGGPLLSTYTVSGGYWSVYYSGFACGTARSYTVSITDYTLTGNAGPSGFLAPCQSCGTGGGSGYYVSGSGSTGGGCKRNNVAFDYTISLVNPCNADTARNDTTYVYADGMLAYTHTRALLAPCATLAYTDAFTLNTGVHVLSYTHISYDSTGRHEHSRSDAVTIEPDLPELYLGSFSQTGATAFSVRDVNPTCVSAGAHKVYLYDSLSGAPAVLLDSFTVAGIAGAGSQLITYSKPNWQMGYHYLQLVTDVHHTVAERDEQNNVLQAVLYVPFPELTVSDVALSASNIAAGSVINFSATLHNTGSNAGAFKVQFLANGQQVGNKVLVGGLAGGNTTSLVVSDAYTIPADSCPILITAIVDADQDIAELLEHNNSATMDLASDLNAGVSCNGLGSSCNPYVVVKNALTHFTTVVGNTGSRDAGNVAVKYTLSGTTIGSDAVPAVMAKSSATSGLYYAFAHAGNYVIAVTADSGNRICELNEGNNNGSIFVRVVEGLPDLEILSHYISPGNLNPNPNQGVTVAASIFNAGTLAAAPTKVRFYVDNVQLGADVQLDSIAVGRDTTVLATAVYASATVGPKIIKVVADAANLVAELRENNNEATRAIIVGGAPDLAHSINEAITFSRSGFRKNELVEIRNYIRNYGGDSGRAYLRYYITRPNGVKSLLDSVQFTLQPNDSMRVSKTWLVDMEGTGMITTEIAHSDPQEFNEFNNTDSLVFVAGPELKIASLNVADSVICDGMPLNIGFTVHKGGQPVTYEWLKDGVATGNTSATLYSLQAAALADSGSYMLRATDSFGTIQSPAKHIQVKPVLVPSVSVSAYPGAVICDGTSVKFTAAAVNAGTGAAYQWLKNGVNVGGSDMDYIDTALATGDVILCQVTGNGQCISAAPVTSGSIAMTVNPLSGGLAGANASQTYTVDSGMYMNYTDNGCQLIATVAAAMGNDLGPTTATTSINTSLTGFVQRFTEITPTYNLPAVVRLYFLQSEFDAYNVWANANGQPLLPASAGDPAKNNIVIYQYHGLPSAGTTGPGGQYDANNATLIRTNAITKVFNATSGYWEITFPVSAFSGHFLKALSPVPLTIRLDKIAAVNKDRVNEISWNTLHEDAGDYFELERSTNGQDFIKLARVAGKAEAASYQYTDMHPVSGTNYYRLRMVEAGGRYGLSNTVTAAVKQGSFAIEAYPNPAKAILNIRTYAAAANGSVRITDIAGKVLLSQDVTADKLQLDISKLTPGVYFIKYADEVNQQTLRIMREE